MLISRSVSLVESPRVPHAAMSDPMADVDCDVLSDVLAFLEDMDEQHTDLDSTLSSLSSDSDARSSTNSPPSTVVPPTTTTATPKRSNASRTHAQGPSSKLPRPRRLDRYWTKKHEMNKLRGEVEYLSNKLELLRQCARSPAEIKMTSELGVTIRKVCHRRVANLKRLATHERVMRERAERTNAKLRVLLQYQRQWTDSLGSEVAQATDVLEKVRRRPGMHSLATAIAASNRCELLQIPQLSSDSRAVATRSRPSVHKPKSKMHDVTWGKILLQLYYEAVAFATGGFAARIESFDWTDCSEPSLRSKPLLEWTTSFPVPDSDPLNAGSRWWQSIHQRRRVRSVCESSDGVSLLVETPRWGKRMLTTPGSQVHDGVVPRIEKTCKWSILDESNGRELQTASVTVFENRQYEGLWIMASTATVYNAAGTAVLFRTAASITVTKGTGIDAQSCVVRANYRIHAPKSLLTPGEHVGDTSEYGAGFDAEDAKLAINNFVNVIRAKDHEVQHEFLQEAEAKAVSVRVGSA